MPSVQRAQIEYQKSGVPLLAISVDGQGGQAARPFLNEHKYTLPVPLDPEMAVARAVGVRVVPWTVVFDRTGAAVAGGYGPIDLNSAAFHDYVKALAARPPG